MQDKSREFLKEFAVGVAKELVPTNIVLWDVSESEFHAWDAFTQSGFSSHAEYQQYLAELETYLSQHGFRIIRVRCSVEAMAAELHKRGWENNPSNRAAVIASLGATSS